MKTKGEQHSCQGKVAYETKGEASVAASRLNDRGGDRVSSYKCDHCGKYHYGHSSGKSNKPEADRKYKQDYTNVNMQARLKRGYCVIRRSA